MHSSKSMTYVSNQSSDLIDQLGVHLNHSQPQFFRLI